MENDHHILVRSSYATSLEGRSEDEHSSRTPMNKRHMFSRTCALTGWGQGSSRVRRTRAFDPAGSSSRRQRRWLLVAPAPSSSLRAAGRPVRAGGRLLKVTRGGRVLGPDGVPDLGFQLSRITWAPVLPSVHTDIRTIVYTTVDSSQRHDDEQYYDDIPLVNVEHRSTFHLSRTRLP
jgi:hypothetical protein